MSCAVNKFNGISTLFISINIDDTADDVFLFIQQDRIRDRVLIKGKQIIDGQLFLAESTKIPFFLHIRLSKFGLIIAESTVDKTRNRIRKYMSKNRVGLFAIECGYFNPATFIRETAVGTEGEVKL